MSREFGDELMSGFMHQKIEYAAEDCKHGRYELTHKLGDVLKSLSDIAYSVSSAEAGDAIEGDAIINAIKELKSLKASVQRLEDYLKPYDDVMKSTIRSLHGRS